MNKIKFNDLYTIENAIAILQKNSLSSINETLSLCLISNIENKVVIRDFCYVPFKIGSSPRISVYAAEFSNEQLKKLDITCFGDKLKNKLLLGILDFDFLITTPVSFASLKLYSKNLKSKGLMPSVAQETVSSNISATILKIQKGTIKYTIEKLGYIHTKIGFLCLLSETIVSNFKFFLYFLKNKINFIYKKKFSVKKAFIISTFGLRLEIDLSFFNAF